MKQEWACNVKWERGTHFRLVELEHPINPVTIGVAHIIVFIVAKLV